MRSPYRRRSATPFSLRHAPNDPAMADELVQLLAAHAREEGIMEGPAVGTRLLDVTRGHRPPGPAWLRIDSEFAPLRRQPAVRAAGGRGPRKGHWPGIPSPISGLEGRFPIS